MYTGLSAALLCQATYTTARMGNFAIVHTNSLLTPSYYVYFMHQFSLKNSLIVEC
jgi:hypothetical protein